MSKIPETDALVLIELILNWNNSGNWCSVDSNTTMVPHWVSTAVNVLSDCSTQNFKQYSPPGCRTQTKAFAAHARQWISVSVLIAVPLHNPIIFRRFHLRLIGIQKKNNLGLFPEFQITQQCCGMSYHHVSLISVKNGKEGTDLHWSVASCSWKQRNSPFVLFGLFIGFTCSKCTI